MRHALVIPALCAAAALSVCLSVCPASAAGPEGAPPPEARQSVGLVLSGGGCKGIAHIGAIQALEDNGIPVDYIAGTSMGAIVAGLYAAGYTPREMMDLILSPEFVDWSTGRINPEEVYYFTSERPSPAFVKIPVAKGDSAVTSLLPSCLISPLPMNFAFMELFAPYTAQCGEDFDRLMVPFRCVSSDVTNKRKYVWRRGDYAVAIRSSMSFPIVFHSVQYDGMTLVDGGVYDNFPVGVMHDEFHPDIMLGIDVSTDSKDAPRDMVDELENLVIQNNDYDLPPQWGIKLHMDLNRFGLLNFQEGGAIYKIGYDRMMGIMDSVCTRVTARRSAQEVARRRREFREATPTVLFATDSVRVHGASSPHMARYIRYQFQSNLRPPSADTFGLAHARQSYYRCVTPGRLTNLIPYARPLADTTPGLCALELYATPKKQLDAGVGGYLTSSTNSFLYFSAGYNTMSLRAVSARLGAWVGQSYMAADVEGSWMLGTRRPSALKAQAAVSRQKFYESDYLFYEDKVPTFIINSEAMARLGWSVAAGDHGAAAAWLGGAYLNDRFYQGNTTEDYNLGRDRAHYWLGQLRLDYERNTLDDQTAPTAGHRVTAVGMAVAGHYRFCPVAVPPDGRHVRWLQAEVRTADYWQLSRRWGVGLVSDVLLSTRRLVGDYNASLVQAPAYYPSPSAYNAFNPALRANSFIAGGVEPYFRVSSMVSLRLLATGFLPLRKILEGPGGEARHGRWLSNPAFFGEMSAVFALPFATLRGYVNYVSFPARNWNVGISFGLFFLAPKFLR